MPDEQELKLSDAFMGVGTDSCVEVKARLINLNQGRNPELLAACKPLADYAKFVNYVRIKQEQGATLRVAVDLAVEQAIRDDLLDGYFRICSRRR